MTGPNILHEFITGVKNLLDLLSYTVVLGVVVEALPPIAAAMSITWLGLQMFAWFRRKAWQTNEERDA